MQLIQPHGGLKIAFHHRWWMMTTSWSSPHACVAETTLRAAWVVDQKRFSLGVKQTPTRMWANAQRDGRPAEYRWRPLFNAANFGWRPMLERRAVTLPRRETHWNLQRCIDQTRQQISAGGRPKFAILWGHVDSNSAGGIAVYGRPA